MKKMNRQTNRSVLHKAAEKALIRDELNSRIAFAATHPTGDVLEYLNAALTGLDEEAVTASRLENGSNKVTKEKKKSLPARQKGSPVRRTSTELSRLTVYGM